ncbi:MAG: hypothetical protein K9J17_07030 [Flavobacteriales bacterium]|nr:hypothetical protein [Flavobacteriales bacterium]
MSVNKISFELTAQEKTDLNTALTTIRGILNPKCINLTPDGRKEFGSVGDERIAWILKVRSYMQQYPQIIPFFVDAVEHDKDFNAFGDLMPFVQQFAELTDMLSDTKLLTGYDLWQNSLSIYNYVALLSEQQNIPGITPLYEDLKKEFPGRGPKPTSTEPTEPETPETPSDTSSPS